MTQKLLQFMEENQEDISEKWFAKTGDMVDHDQMEALSNEAANRYNREFFNVIMYGLQDPSEQQKQMQEFVEKMGQLGWPLTYISRGLQHFRTTLFDLFYAKVEKEDFADLVQGLDKLLNPFVDTLIQEYGDYTAKWRKMVDVQRLALKELSAPLIPVFDKISVMPLIGTIDTERAKLIMENLLQGVIKHESKVVLIDITGVPLVDTMVAHHIIQAVEAVRLVGAQGVIVGIRPEIAQTIVTLGIDLTDIQTMSTLRKGILTALQITGREVVDTETREKKD